MKKARETIKTEIVKALKHSEAEDGLYLRNFRYLHEEDTRPAVVADEADILDALNDLVSEGKVVLDQSEEEVVFRLKT